MAKEPLQLGPGGARRRRPLCRQAGLPLPLLLSAVGRDAAGDALVAAWEAFGASSRRIARLDDGGTPVVSMILDGTGEVLACPHGPADSLLCCLRLSRTPSRGHPGCTELGHLVLD